MISNIKIRRKTVILLSLIFVVAFLLFDIFCHLIIKDKDYVFQRYENGKDKSDFENKGAFIELSMINIINQKKDRVIFSVYSKEKFDNFNLNNIVILINDNENKISKKLEVKNCETSFKPCYISGNKIDCYEMKFYGNNEYKYTANFYNLFKKEHIDIGKNFDVNLIVNFSLDDNVYIQELEYQVSCVEAERYPPNWFMFIFSGAY